ncbi:MAG: RNA polymerase sigma-I factor [Actinomycetota bacterium]|nr:RNA polymerase sigma-I factor [Actinomycetota bacterium]
MALHRQTLENRVVEVRGDKFKTSRLIYEFRPFIAGVIQKRAGRFVEYGVDEEFSIGLSAFKEAMDSYDREKGKFLSFARMVIDRRVIDYYRKENKRRTISLEDKRLSGANFEGNGINYREQYAIDEDKEERMIETLEYRSELEKWGISLEELAEVSPKSSSLREEYKNIAKSIVDDDGILRTLMETRRLPLKKIENIISVHRKKLERGRIYIIAMVLAILNNLSYVDVAGGG